MNRQIRKHGNSKVIAIPKQIIKEFNLEAGSNLKFEVKENKIVMEVVK